MDKNYGEWCDHCGKSCVAEWDDFAGMWLCPNDFGRTDDDM